MKKGRERVFKGRERADAGGRRTSGTSGRKDSLGERGLFDSAETKKGGG